MQIPKPVIIANTPANRYSLLPRVYGLDVMAHQLRRRDCNPQIAYTRGNFGSISPKDLTVAVQHLSALAIGY